MTVQLTARNASAQELIQILNSQKARKLDVVAPARSIWSRDGKLVVANTVAEVTEDGVTPAAGTYSLTDIADRGLADKLNIGQTYFRRMREAGRNDLIDGNVNGWLHGNKSHEGELLHPSDERSFLLRLFQGEEGQPGVARAVLSDRFNLSMDNLDMLLAVTQGIQAAGVQPVVNVSDLSESRMRVRFEFPQVSGLAEGLLDGYRSPFSGPGGMDNGLVRAGHRDLSALRRQYGDHHIFNKGDEPIAYMGLDFDNSETGSGAYNLTPVVVLVRCTNGWTDTRRGIRKVHLGKTLSEGVIRPSLETVRAAGQLIKSETTDAVTQWLTPDYLASMIAGFEEKAAVPVTSATEVVPKVCAGLGFTAEESKSVMDFFILSGQPTAGGVANAITAYAQTLEDPDRAYEVERLAVPALEAVAVRR
jgi:hypothetical protein